MLAYHFTGETLRDGSPIPPTGEWLQYDGLIEICETGLHASYHPFDALRYAPGNLLHIVEVEGIHTRQEDKFVCSRRKIIKTIDSDCVNREFARWCALQVVNLWDAPEVVVDYLETGDEYIRGSALAAAQAAAWEAAREAARAARAARAAAWEAAREAAWEAALAAAQAAQAAAWEAAREAARAAAWEAAREAARAAAWGAAQGAAQGAWEAACCAQRAKYFELVNEEFKQA